MAGAGCIDAELVFKRPAAQLKMEFMYTLVGELGEIEGRWAVGECVVFGEYVGDAGFSFIVIVGVKK